MDWVNIYSLEDGLSVRNKLNTAVGYLINPPYRNVSSLTNVLSTDRFIYVDSSGGDVQINLQSSGSSLNDGNLITIIRVNSGGGNVIINPAGADTIMGQSNMTLRFQYDKVTLQIRNGETDWIPLP